MDTKSCGDCKEYKPKDCFRTCKDKRAKKGCIEYLCSICKACERARALTRYHNKKEECLAKAKEYKERNKDVLKEKRKIYLQQNKEYVRERYKRYCANNKTLIQRISREYREKNYLNIRLRTNFKNRILENIHKQQPTMDYLGTSMSTVKTWLEYNFTDGMSWENYGEFWQIDHTLPLNLFDLTKNLDIYICFNWKNLMPLQKLTNIKKHNHIWHYRVFFQETRLCQFVKDGYVEKDEVNDFLDVYCEYFKTMMNN